MKTIIAIDIDGTINPFVQPHKSGMRDLGYTSHRHIYHHPHTHQLVKEWVWVNPRLATNIAHLAARHNCELVWLTYWRHLANTWLAPRLGLPTLPVIDVPDPFSPDATTSTWEKYKALLAYAGDRRWVWFDDDIPPRARVDQEAAHGYDRNLLAQVHPEAGITNDHLSWADLWLSRPKPKESHD
jgi:hypothetical protein